MANKTDPAREIVDICEQLSGSSKSRGDEHIAKQLRVLSWSAEFYQCIFCIVDRINFLESIIKQLNTDEDIKSDALRHTAQLKQAFAYDALAVSWVARGQLLLGQEHTQPIKMLSPLVRAQVSYPKLDQEEIGNLVGQLDDLLNWLQDTQLAEHDFIRQALIDGLKTVHFRLERIGWLGWGYTVASLREVIGAYLALQSGLPSDASAPDAEVLLKKVGKFLKLIYEVAGTAKEATETMGFYLQLYGLYRLGVDAASVSGLIEYHGASKP